MRPDVTSDVKVEGRRCGFVRNEARLSRVLLDTLHVDDE